MAPDFRGRTTGPWEPWLHALPAEFGSEQAGARRVRAGGRAVLRRRRSTGHRRGGGCTAVPSAGSRSPPSGGPGTTGSSGRRCGRRRCSSRRATPSLRPARCGEMHETGSGHVSARAGRRPPGSRRRAAGIPRRGRGVLSDVRPARLRRARRHVLEAGADGVGVVFDAVRVGVVFEQPADHRRGEPELVGMQAQVTARCAREARAATSANGASRMTERQEFTFMAAILRPKISRQQWQSRRHSVKILP